MINIRFSTEILVCLIFLLILSISCSPAEPEIDAVQPAESTAVEIPPAVQEAADTYAKLRPIAGQFAGGAWDSAADDWHGEKHLAMLKLAEFADTNQLDETSLKSLMGEPDLTVRENEKRLNLIQTLPDVQESSPNSVFLVYFWRGEHDFLFFESDGGIVKQSGWWYAME